jgi:purine-binding chemotaxis protein CheW
MDALLFELAGARLAVSAACVIEVVRAVAIDALPEAPPVVSGVINLRGEVMPVIDMRKRFGLPARPALPEDYFIAVQSGPHRVALHVDRPLELERVTPTPFEQLVDTPARYAYVSGVVPTLDGVLLICDLPRFLSAPESLALSRALSTLEGAA